jgi:hypothetical protein
MNNEQRCGYLPQAFRELISRLQSSQVIGSEGRVSIPAAEHARDRRRQRYSAAMLVEESRLLEVSIFQTLQNHMASIDFRLVLPGVMVIADEIDSQLSQAVASYMAESMLDSLAAQLPSAAFTRRAILSVKGVAAGQYLNFPLSFRLSSNGCSPKAQRSHRTTSPHTRTCT